jgi:2-polyprenyl-3-methyl-5-hydroxy-6-metoxy-1,4-benzoquinol methylase
MARRYARTVDSSNLAGRVHGTLLELIRPDDYVTWEYLSRQWLLAGELLAGSGGHRGRILDVGCGYGALSLSLSEGGPGFEIVAMDILPSRIDSVRGKLAARQSRASDRVSLLVADAQRLPFRPNTFDAVIATEVMEHLDAPQRLFEEVHRVLRQRGRFLMTTPNARALPYRLLRLLPEGAVRKLAAMCTQTSLHPDLLHPHGDAEGGHDPDRHRREGFSLPELRASGVEVGLRIVAGHAYRIPLPDRIMSITPRILARSVARLGSRHLPLGLQVFAEFQKP